MKFLDVGAVTVLYTAQEGHNSPRYNYVVFPQQDKCGLCGHPKTQCYLACTQTFHDEGPWSDEEYEAYERSNKSWR